MTFSTLRRILLALAMVAPVTAAHPAETRPLGPEDFARAFDAFGQDSASPAPVATDEAAVIGHTHSPAGDAADETEAGKALGAGVASFYGRQFDGRRTASGERFDMGDFTAAHRTLPFGSKVRVTNAANGRSVVVRINDRGPFHGGRLIDLSQAAAARLGLVARGSGRVELALLD